MRPTVATIEAAGGIAAYRQKINQRGRLPLGSQHPIEHDCWLTTAADPEDWEHAVGIQNHGWLPSGASGYFGMELTTPIYTPFVQAAGDHTDTQLWAQTGECENWFDPSDNCIRDASCTNCTGPSCANCEKRTNGSPWNAIF